MVLAFEYMIPISLRPLVNVLETFQLTRIIENGRRPQFRSGSAQNMPAYHPGGREGGTEFFKTVVRGNDCFQTRNVGGGTQGSHLYLGLANGLVKHFRGKKFSRVLAIVLMR